MKHVMISSDQTELLSDSSSNLVASNDIAHA